ncbi:MAG: pyruvate kinase [Verrucomicrobiota bacterium]
MPAPYRHTKIIVTLGPATESEEKLRSLITSGVDVVRLNMAHANEEWTRTIVERIRNISAEVSRQVAIMMDVKGPEIRTAFLEEGINLNVGDHIDFVTTGCEDPEVPGIPRVGVNYPGLPADVEVDNTVLVDSGLIQLKVLEKTDTRIRSEVLIPGHLGSRRHINLPGVKVNLPSLTEKDRNDVALGTALGVDFFALSFAREAGDIRALRSMLKLSNSQARIIAKIEDQSALQNLNDIVRESDGIMVARGDLGIEIEYHQLPIVQQTIVNTCMAEGKPVIIATHLLESMIASPIPTRAEISDVATAVKELADCVMLSGETTTGQYPEASVDVLQHIIASIEADSPADAPLNETIRLKTAKAKMLRAAAVLALDLGGAGIVVFTRSGFLPFVLAALRPRGVPIYAFTDQEEVFRHLLILWGVEPFLMNFSEDHETTIKDAFAYLLRRQWCHHDDNLVVITNALAHDHVIDTIQLRQP